MQIETKSRFTLCFNGLNFWNLFLIVCISRVKFIAVSKNFARLKLSFEASASIRYAVSKTQKAIFFILNE